MIIALGHKKRVGKDTICTLLSQYFTEYNPKIFSFAQPLKQVTHDLYGWAGLKEGDYYETHPQAKMELLPALGKTPRDIWIETGLFFRGICVDTWAIPTIDKAKRQRIALISDLRFENEARLLKEAGAILIRVDRPQVKPTDDAADVALDGFTGWDIVYNNDSLTMSMLEKDLKKNLIPRIVSRIK